MSESWIAPLGIAGCVVVTLSVLVPVIVLQGRSPRRKIGHVRTHVRVDDLAARVDGLSERVARIEGALAGAGVIRRGSERMTLTPPLRD